MGIDLEHVVSNLSAIVSEEELEGHLTESIFTCDSILNDAMCSPTDLLRKLFVKIWELLLKELICVFKSRS